MLSRAVNVPRTCLANRLSSILSARATLSNRSLHSRREWIQQRCYSSDPVIHSKEEIEALISGKVSEREFKKSIKETSKETSKRPFKKSDPRKPWRRRQEEEIPDWGLAPLQIEGNPATQAAIERHLGEGFEGELSEELIEMLAGEVLLKEESAAKELDADESNQPEQSASSQEAAAITEADAVELSQPRPKRGFKAKKDFHDELVQSRSVSVAALGEQIDAIMLKNPNEMKKPKRAVRRLQEDAAEATVELDTERDNMVDVKEESDEEAMAAAMKNIDDLRPVDKTILRMKDFDSLANTLLDGFTFNQLAKYFSQKRLSLSKRDQGTPLRYPWIVKQDPWVAAKPDHWGPLRPKQRQVIMIMQILWNLEVQEQVEGLGRTLVWLQPRIFELIASPNSAVLELLSRDFLYQSNKEKITTSFDDHRINIYAQKSTIPAILSHLDETVKSIRCQSISSDFIQEHDLDEKLLRELERITKTHIVYDENNKELEISWLQKQHPAATGTESPADIALRLLLEQTTKDTQTSVHIITPSDISGIKDGAFVSHQRENRSMSWKDKLGQWSRLVTPVGQASASGDDVSMQFLSVISDLKVTKGTEPVHQVTASFGHVLHRRHSQTVAAMAKHRRLLSPVLPHPASFTSIMGEDKPTTQRATIVLNLSPDPNHSSSKFDSAAPAIQLQLPVNPDSDLTGISLPPGSTLFGVAAQHISDVLMPSESVDVRLTQSRLLPLDASQESVKEFLSQSEFNLPQGVLKTPSKAKFSIPKAWVTKAKTTRKPSKATINVPYIFMGLEIHQTVQLEFHGHTLCYNSIDAGRHGGHRQELSLQAGTPQGKDESSLLLDKDEASRFLSLVEGVATGKYFSWHNGSQLMRETPDVGTLEDEVTEDQLPSLEAEAEDHEHVQTTESESLQNTEHSLTETGPEPSKDIQPPDPDKTKEPERELKISMKRK
ncbi:mitochondrial inner-membrane-bound regulator domain-containing protein [Trichoderma compactum]